MFFGESLPAGFEDEEKKVLEADMVLVMGTSLKVHPAARIPELTREGVPRVLINWEKVGDLGTRPKDICILGECDEGVRQLGDALGWRGELEELWREVAPGGGKRKQPYGAEPDQAIERLRQKTEQAGRISEGHKKMLERHLEEKMK